MATTTARSNPLSYLTDQLNELKAKGTHFRLRVLDDEQAAVCTFDGKKVINRRYGRSPASRISAAALRSVGRRGTRPADCRRTRSW